MANYNSARRLHDFFHYCKSYGNKDKKFGYVLCEYFETNFHNTAELFATIQKYSEMAGKVRKGIREHKDLDSSYLKTLSPILDDYSPSLFDDPLYKVLPTYDDSCRYALHACSSFLGEIENEPEVAEEDLETLSEQLTDLQKEILDAVSDEELRTILLGLVSTAMEGIASYKFTGVVSLKKTYATLYGELLIAYSQYSSSTDPRSEENKSTTSLFDKIGNVLNSIDKTSGNVCTTLELGSNLISTVTAITNALPK